MSKNPSPITITVCLQRLAVGHKKFIRFGIADYTYRGALPW